MARRVFYSFHYAPDNWRASTVRNIGAIEGNPPAHDNDWEEVRRGGDRAIKNWIDSQLQGRSCTVVLIGSQTAGREWINYEIEKTWNDGKGLFGIYIHNLKDKTGNQSSKGSNPFDGITLNGNRNILSSLVKTYDSPYPDSKMAYAYIQENIANWIDIAIANRQR